MGYASTFEAILERHTELMHAVEAFDLGGEIALSGSERDELSALLSRVEAAVCEVRYLLELATDPSIDAAKELARARDEKAQIESRLFSYEQTCKALVLQLEKERNRADALQKKVKELTLDRNRADRELAAAVKSGIAYDAFPVTDKVKRAKNGK